MVSYHFQLPLNSLQRPQNKYIQLWRHALHIYELHPLVSYVHLAYISKPNVYTFRTYTVTTTFSLDVVTNGQRQTIHT